MQEKYRFCKDGEFPRTFSHYITVHAQWQKLHLFPLPASPPLQSSGSENNAGQHAKLRLGGAAQDGHGDTGSSKV